MPERRALPGAWVVSAVVLLCLFVFAEARMTAEEPSERQHVRVSRDTQALNNHFSLDMALSDVQWEMFGTPEWAEDRREMWPTDFVSLIVLGRSDKASIAEKFSNSSDVEYSTPNSGRTWLPPLFKLTMTSLSEGKGAPDGVRCRMLDAPKNNQYESGFACTDGETVLYFISVESYA